MTAKEKYFVKNEKDFQELMESVDEELRNDGFLIFQRPMNAWFKISSRFGLNLIFPPFKKTITEGRFVGDDLTNRIFKWFDDKYGDKLKFDPTWKMVILIRGDAYRMRLPRAYGAFIGICSKKDFGKSASPIAGVNGNLPELNILNLIDEMTQGYVNSLSRSDLENIINCFQTGYSTMNEMETLQAIQLVQQAKGDIDATVSHIFSNPPQYGLSKWSSLQATEKVIKAYIQEKNGNFPFSHDLKKLAQEAQNLGLREIPEALLDLIQCPAGVRYGNPPVNLIESVQAHYACLDICLGVAQQISISRREGKVQLIPNKYYVNGVGHHTRCISVNGDKATMMLFTEVNGNNLEIQYVIDKTAWAEYVRLDISAITRPLEERYQTILRNEAQKREEAIRNIVPYKNK